MIRLKLERELPGMKTAIRLTRFMIGMLIITVEDGGEPGTVFIQLTANFKEDDGPVCLLLESMRLEMKHKNEA